MGWTNTHHLETNVSLAKIILPASSLGEFFLAGGFFLGPATLTLLFPIFPFLEFHHQYAVIANLPPFYDQDLREPVTVSIQVINSNDDTSSNTRQYVYIPNEHAFRTDSNERKRQRVDEEAKRFFGGGNQSPFSGGGGGGSGNYPQSQSGSGHGFDNAGNSSYQGGGFMSHSAVGQTAPEISQLCVKFFSALGDPKYILAAFREASQQVDENGDT